MKKIQHWLSRKKLFVVLVAIFFILIVESFLIIRVWSKTETIDRNGRMNFLILGVRGADHKAFDLTDTMMVVLANQESKKILLLSLPRDIWITPLKTKINTLYHYGGSQLVAREVEKIIGQPIDKVLVVDFRSFEEIIDFVGGVEIEVDHSFDDFYYPIPGKENDLCDNDPEFSCRYEHLYFESGWQAMDGERALKFVRSRNAQGEDGTDFSRNKRQQKLIIALKNKLLSTSFLLDPQKARGLVEVINRNLETDITRDDYASLSKFFLPFLQNLQLETLVLNGGIFDEKELLYHPQYHSSNQWVLLPAGGDWEKVESFVEDKIN